MTAPMERALTLAERARDEDEVPVGAVVLFEGKIVGEGYNRREQHQDPLAHAEIMAIQAAAENLGTWRLERCELYVTLEPCPMCLAACQQSRIARVVYGAPDPKGGALSLGYRVHEDARMHHRFSAELLPDSRCGAILSDFFRGKRKKLV